MTIYRVYDSSWGEDSNVRYYLKEDSASKDYQSRNILERYMDEVDVIED